MERQARAWAFKRTGVLFKIWKDRMLRVMHSGSQVNATHGTIRIDHWAMMILNKLLDLYVEVEIFIRFRTDGFSMIKGIHANMIGALTLEKTEAELNAIYAEMENQRVSNLKAVLAAVQAGRTAERATESFPGFLEAPGLLFDREFSMRSLMKEMDNPKPLGIEAWVQELADVKCESFGFVVYRNSYLQSETEWNEFVETSEASLNSGWEGVLDPANVKQKAKLHWVDGQKEGIPEGDLEAVRKYVPFSDLSHITYLHITRHFKNFTTSPNFPATLTKSVSLVVTPPSYESFSSPNRTGDFRGFFAAIDPNHDPDKQAQQQENNYGFKGHFNITDQLVWTDLFAQQATLHSQKTLDYFRLAAPHPWGVYVGPTTGVKRKQWRLMKQGLTESLRFLGSLRR